MKYLPSFCLLFFLFEWSLVAQPLPRVTTTPATIVFPVLFEYQEDSVSVLVQNNGPAADFRLRIPFLEFGSMPFTIKDSVFTLGENASKSVWIYCKPIHNILNRAHLIILANSSASGVDPITISVSLSANCKYRKAYYDISENLSEELLKQALKNRIGLNYNSLGYNVARDNMYGSLDNVNDSVTCIYTNRKARFNTRAGATANNFNCEHTFPQGFFSQDEPMRSDIHHLFSTDENANNSRGNMPFGIAVPPLVQEAINFPSKNGGGKYEPQDSHKGNCARAMMYFVLRYQDYTGFYALQNFILQQWHRQFQPGPKDTLRNFRIFQLQGNRNPFVDYPQFADRISNLTSVSVSDSTPRLQLSHSEMEFSASTPSDADRYHSLVVFNPGHKAVFVRPQIVGGSSSLSFQQDTAFSLSKNQARVIWLKKNCGQVADTLVIRSNDAVNPVQKVPMKCLLSSVQKPLSKRAVSLIPNPAKDKVVISHLPEHENWSWEIFNALGQRVFSQIGNIENGQSVSLSSLVPGIYHFVLKSDKEIIFQKLQVEAK